MKLLIFDFDGTIVDSKHVYYRAISKHLSSLGFSKKDVDKAIDIGLSISETLKYLKFSFFLRWFLKRRIMKNVLQEVNKVKKCKDVDFIRKLKAEKILISNSLSEFIFPVLRHLKLRKYFKEVYGSEQFDSKENFIRDYLRKNKIKKENCFYIGDRVADVEVARKVKCKSVIILGKCAWNSRSELLRAEPDYIIEDLRDLDKII